MITMTAIEEPGTVPFILCPPLLPERALFRAEPSYTTILAERLSFFTPRTPFSPSYFVL